MAICIIKSISQLDEKFILTPERYNPRRRMSVKTQGMKLSEIVYISEETITMKNSALREFYQINTGDAMGGYLQIPSSKTTLKSNKKILRKGDVIISRLRPYLKQIAYVDETKGEDALYASTEFYVLRSRNTESISFLVPYLLSNAVQTVFENAVEGSQHPRFKVEDLNNLIIPETIYCNKQRISQEVEKSLEHYRRYEKILSEQVQFNNNNID